MTSIEKLTPERFPEVFETFLRDDDPDVEESLWRGLFTLQGASDEGHSGYVLVDGTKVVGMLGTRLSTRVIDGRRVHFCNLHNWNVHPEYRGKSLLLMRPVLRMREHTLTDFTPTEAVYELSQRLGFRPLDSSLCILLPSRRGRKSSFSTNVEITEVQDDMRGVLSEPDVKILGDHQGDEQRHLLVMQGDAYCYIVYNRNDRHWMPYAHIHYISNLEVFENCQWLIRSKLIGPEGRRFAAVDQRRLGDKTLPQSFRCPLRSRQLFRPSSVSEQNIDSLYSELCYLDLTTFPGLRSGLRDFLGRSQIGRYVLGVGQRVGIPREYPIPKIGASRHVFPDA